MIFNSLILVVFFAIVLIVHCMQALAHHTPLLRLKSDAPPALSAQDCVHASVAGLNSVNVSSFYEVEPFRFGGLGRAVKVHVGGPLGCDEHQSEHCERDLRQLGSLYFAVGFPILH